jgi:hypothetical protein
VKVGDLVRQRFNGRWDDVGLVLDIKQSTYGSVRFRDIGMVSVLWGTDQEERKTRRYRVRDLEVINE